MGQRGQGVRRARGLTAGVDAAATLARLVAGDRTYAYYSLGAAERLGLNGVAQLPYTLRIVLENVLRQSAQGYGAEGDIARVISWLEGPGHRAHVKLHPARVMMDDTAGLPLIGELAAMREAVRRLDGGASPVDLALPVDFVVDHSVIADYTGIPDALERNMALEMKRNAERYRLLRWAAHTFPRLKVVPPGRGICHQINLEYLAQVVCSVSSGSELLAFPDTMVGIDSHTPMINGLGIVGWSTSGIEGLAAALGEPVAMQLPGVIGCRLSGALRPGVNATDLVLTLTRKLRERGVVGQVMEYFGPGVSSLRAQDRATVANMTPEAGATMSYFPIDRATVDYLRQTGRAPDHVALVEAYAKAQGVWADETAEVPLYDAIVEVDLAEIEPSVAGPCLPHQRVALGSAPAAFGEAPRPHGGAGIGDGDVVIAAITSCTNTSNPALMIGAGLLARNAVRRGLGSKPWVKTSLSPGSRVVADYLKRSGLQDDLDRLGFHVAGFGCMTCVGFSGQLPTDVEQAVVDDGVRAVAVLSGNRNYEGRAHPLIRSTFLVAPPLVVAYALSGTIARDLTSAPVAIDATGAPVYLAELWPDAREVEEIIASCMGPSAFTRAYSDVLEGTAEWRALEFGHGPDFLWQPGSTFIARPGTYEKFSLELQTLRDLRGARVLAMYGDMVTTEHLSPMGQIPEGSPAARYLESLGVAPPDFVSYAARRLNHEVMVRGALASPHLRNELAPQARGGLTRHMPDGACVSVFEAAQRYAREGVPLVLIAGQAFGAGSSRDWSAKGPAALGVRAIIAESYERIYRSNLVAAGVLPLQFGSGASRKSLGLNGAERIDIEGLASALAPRARLEAIFARANGETLNVPLTSCLESADEVEYIRHGGLLMNLLRRRMSVAP